MPAPTPTTESGEQSSPILPVTSCTLIPSPAIADNSADPEVDFDCSKVVVSTQTWPESAEGKGGTYIFDALAALHGTSVAVAGGGRKDNEGEGRNSGEAGEHDVLMGWDELG